ADFNDVAALQQVFLDRLTVDGGAVGRAEVLEVHVGAVDEDDRVLAAYGEVVDHQVVVRAAADGRALFCKVDLAQHGTVQAQYQLRDLCVLQGVRGDGKGILPASKKPANQAFRRTARHRYRRNADLTGHALTTAS